ncbi:MAG: phosphatase PAP2 family protein [Treponema sp.]|jgi:membrane-associated phospholipid phosphatase|nr:phosphatase PAP2 family protein [Treponema sp.]
MESILQWGLDLIRSVQNFSSPPLTAFMKIATWFGAAPSYLVLLSLIFWCIDEKKGARLGVAVMVSLWLNIILKFLLNQPRPFWEGYDPSVGLVAEKLNGFPSGHAQISLVLWIIIASFGKKKRYYAAAVLFVLLISFSRVYLGVHFPTDIAGGWLLGGIVLAVYFIWGDALEALLVRGGLRTQLIASAAAAFIMILCNPQSAREVQGGIEVQLMPGGLLLGMGAGYSLTAHYLRFRAAGLSGRGSKLPVLLARFILGMAGVALIFVVFRKINGILGADYIRMGIFFRFALMELWIYAGAVRVFQFFKLAEREQRV